MSGWAKPGVKAVFLGHLQPRPETVLLEGGKIYTIRKVFASPHNGELGCYVEEVINDIHPAYKIERGYYLRRFRPVIPLKTESEDIAVFRRIADLAGVDGALRRLEGVE